MVNFTTTEGPDWTGCIWGGPNHGLFQAGMACFLLSLLSFHGIYGLIWLRAVLSFGCIFLAIWGWVVLCAVDTFLWNFILTVINLIYLFILLYAVRPIKLANEDFKMCYTEFFQPVGMRKQVFKVLSEASEGVEILETGTLYAVENETLNENLSLLLSGKIKVTYKNDLISQTEPISFIDGPEYLISSQPHKFQVTLQADEYCKIIKWKTKKLETILKQQPELPSAFESLLGKDTALKLIAAKKYLHRRRSLVAAEGIIAAAVPARGLVRTQRASEGAEPEDVETVRLLAGISDDVPEGAGPERFAAYRKDGAKQTLRKRLWTTTMEHTHKYHTKSIKSQNRVQNRTNIVQNPVQNRTNRVQNRVQNRTNIVQNRSGSGLHRGTGAHAHESGGSMSELQLNSNNNDTNEVFAPSLPATSKRKAEKESNLEAGDDDIGLDHQLLPPSSPDTIAAARTSSPV